MFKFIEKAIHNRKARITGIVSVFVIVLLVYPGANLMTFFSARRTIREQNSTIASYQKEIIRLRSERENLTGCTDSLEKFARENFHFTQDGEDLYIHAE